MITDGSWQEKEIRQVGEVITGTTPSTKRPEYYGEEYKLISPADLDNGKYVTTAHRMLTAEGLAQCRVLPRDAVLVGCIGNVGKIGMVADDQAASNQQINAVICDQDHDPHFIYYSLSFNRERLEHAAVKTTVPILNKSNFEKFIVEVPPLDEQRRIAHVLSTVQTAIEQQERLIALTSELKSVLMHKLFTEGLRGEKQKQTESGLVPQNWETTKLGNVCSIATGTTPATGKEEYYGGDVPFVRTSEIANNRIKSAATYITQKAIEECNLKVYPANTVFMAMYGQGKTRGQVAILDIPATTSQNTAAIKCGESVNPEFLWHWLMSRYDSLRNTGALGHLSHLNLGYVKAYEIALPPIEEQNEIARSLNAMGNKVSCTERKRSILAELFRTLLHQLMTAQIRV